MLDALACIGTAVALFSVVKRQHEGFALGICDHSACSKRLSSSSAS